MFLHITLMAIFIHYMLIFTFTWLRSKRLLADKAGPSAVQITKQELFDFRFCQGKKQEKKTIFTLNFVFHSYFVPWQKRNSEKFLFCNLYFALH